MNRRRKQSIWLRRNLPLLIAVAALVLLVLIIVLVARGCSKSSDTVIKAKAFSTGTTIDLPLFRLLRRLSVHDQEKTQRADQAHHQK